MEKTTIGTSLHIVDCTGLKIDVEGTGNVFARTGLREESGETAVSVGWRALLNTSIWLQKD
jgi:hypothetical protein